MTFIGDAADIAFEQGQPRQPQAFEHCDRFARELFRADPVAGQRL